MKAGHKPCPRCAEPVRFEAKLCRFCNHNFSAQEIADRQRAKIISSVGNVIVTFAILGFVFWFIVPMIIPRSAPVSQLTSLNLTQPTPIFTADDASEKRIKRETKTYCAGEYPNDYMMRGACTRNAYQGAHDFIAIWNRYRGDEGMRSSLAGCYHEYARYGGHDWMMIGACARNNEQGYLSTQ